MYIGASQNPYESEVLMPRAYWDRWRVSGLGDVMMQRTAYSLPLLQQQAPTVTKAPSYSLPLLQSAAVTQRQVMPYAPGTWGPNSRYPNTGVTQQPPPSQVIEVTPVDGDGSMIKPGDPSLFTPSALPPVGWSPSPPASPLPPWAFPLGIGLAVLLFVKR